MKHSNNRNFDLDVSEEDIPEKPGPAVVGRTPVLGTIRRNNEMPVLRDELEDIVEDI